jgi:tRNA(Ile)-lysidine synthase
MRASKSSLAKTLLADLQATLPKPGAKGRYVVAYSGGLDSTVLLHLMLQAHAQVPLLAVHVHHGLQPAAEDWPAHCQQVCGRWQVPLTLLRVTPAQGPGLSLEAEARRARYQSLQAILREGDVLLTAHHQDDQAETLLLQLLRGAGPRGLAAMPSVSEFAPGLHARPLLNSPRIVLESYAGEQGLSWIDDPSNSDTAHARNFLRRELMPLLRQRWPEMAGMLGRSARLCAEAAEMLDWQARQDLDGCAGGMPACIHVPALMRLEPMRRRNLLRAWIGWLGLPLPEAQHLRRIDRELLDAADDAMPVLSWPGAELRRYRDGLYAMPTLPPVEVDWRSGWQLGERLQLPAGCGWLDAESGLASSALRLPRADEPVSVRLARDGERIRLPGRVHRHALKKLCQDAGIAPWLRRRMPVVFYGDSPAAVADRWICDGFTAKAGETGWQLHWHDAPAGYGRA